MITFVWSRLAANFILVQGSAIVIDIGPGDLTIIGIRDIRPQILFSGDIYTTTHVYVE